MTTIFIVKKLKQSKHPIKKLFNYDKFFKRIVFRLYLLRNIFTAFMKEKSA